MDTILNYLYRHETFYLYDFYHSLCLKYSTFPFTYSNPGHSSSPSSDVIVFREFRHVI